MNRNLLSKIAPEKKDWFLCNAADLYNWDKTVDRSLSFIFKALELDTIQQDLIQCLVNYAITLGQEKAEVKLTWGLDNDEVQYIQDGWFNCFELKEGFNNAK